MKKVYAICSGLILAVFSISASAQDAALANPERGFRFEIRVGIEGSAQTESQWPFADYRSEGITVSQAYCYLSDYWDRPVSQGKLDALQSSFDRARRDGVKFLLRFAYAGGGNPEAAPSLGRILSHMEQLTPLVRQNADVIYALQVGWIGLWGEFHDDPSGLDRDPAAVAAVLGATLDMLPPSRMTMMRCMRYRDLAMRGAGDSISLDMGRVGFFNDGTLANASDGGTFIAKGGNPRLAEDGSGEFDAVSALGPGMPVDGELFWSPHTDTLRANAASTLARFIKHHYSTFSIVHSNSAFNGQQTGAIDAWKRTAFSPRMLDSLGLPCDTHYFESHPAPSGYEYIRDHLGYRIELTGASIARRGRSLKGSIRLRNTGCASPVNPRSIYLVLLDDCGSVMEIPTGTDARMLRPWEEIEIPVDIQLKGRLIRRTRLALWLPDEDPLLRYRPPYAIEFSYGTVPYVTGGRKMNVIP